MNTNSFGNLCSRWGLSVFQVIILDILFISLISSGLLLLIPAPFNSIYLFLTQSILKSKFLSYLCFIENFRPYRLFCSISFDFGVTEFKIFKNTCTMYYHSTHNTDTTYLSFFAYLFLLCPRTLNLLFHQLFQIRIFSYPLLFLD